MTYSLMCVRVIKYNVSSFINDIYLAMMVDILLYEKNGHKTTYIHIKCIKSNNMQL